MRKLIVLSLMVIFSLCFQNNLVFAVDANSTEISLIDQPDMVVTGDDLTYKLNEDKCSYTVTGYSWFVDGNVIIPSTYNDLPVTKIGDYAFGSRSLSSIIINEGITEIGHQAFDGCENLQDITLPNSLEIIGSLAFNQCKNLMTIEIPQNVTTIEEYAFYDCINLSNIQIPDNVNSIGPLAFCNTSFYNNEENWTGEVLYINNHLIQAKDTLSGEYSVRDNVKTIAGYAFKGCTNLTKINFSNSIVEIGNAAFENCEKLESIVLPEQCKVIRQNAFEGCGNLKSVTFSKNLVFIDDVAFPFWSCRKLDYIFYNGSAEDWKNIYIGINNIIGNRIHYDGKGHQESNWEITKNSTCKEKGERITKCTICYTTLKTEEIALLTEHKFKNSCDDSCDVCGKTRNIAHTYKTSTTKATLSANGKIIKKCSVCDHTDSVTTICKPNIFALSSTSYTYDGKVKTPSVTVKDSAGNIISSSNYTVTYASGRKNAGTYKVTVTMKGNYTGTKTLTFRINPINISKCAVKLSTTSYTYNGSVKTPSVIVKNANGTTLTKGTHYTVTYASGRKNAGTYKVTVAMKGNYTGSKTLTFRINPISISKCELALSKTSYTYDGKSKIPSVIVLNHKGTKLTDSSYTVTYEKGRKNVGTYKVTVKMKGNYSGTKTLSFKINPVKTAVSKLTAGKKSIMVAITKKSTQITGYQIQYSTSKTFSKATTKTISSYKKTKYTLKSLSAKKTYYVRVRSYKKVGSKTYYSGWSTYKYVKTK